MTSLAGRLQAKLLGTVYGAVVSGWLPRRFVTSGPRVPQKLPPSGPVRELEVVSHCWNYDHLLAYQLSSLVLYPPQTVNVCMTVFYCPEDTATEQLLRFFESQSPQCVRWNWCPLERSELFRRSIGRNRAALATQADWIWFTDCDQVFRQDCLDSVASQLSGCRSPLAYPREVRCTPLLEPRDQLLYRRQNHAVVDIETARFEAVAQDRANGASQIVRGDIARQFGYCRDIPLYQRPVTRWAKAREDRVFRWLIGSQGEPVDVAGVYRIEHLAKGRADGPVKKLCRRFRIWRRGKSHARSHGLSNSATHCADVPPDQERGSQVQSNNASERRAA